MRLIDADALEKEMCSGCEYNKNKYANCDDCAIANAPTIDAVEVVRCKDCEYWTKQSNSLQGRCALSGSYPTGAWYCANAERREP